MSKRFGRNQKRRLREQLDKACHAARHAKRDAAHARMRLDYIEEAARRLRYPGLLPPEILVVDADPREAQRLHGILSSPERFDAPGLEPLDLVMPPPVDMVAIAADITLNPLRYRLDVHFFAESTSGHRHTWAYHVSPRMLATGIGPREQRDIANRIGGEIVAVAHRHFRLKGGL